MGKFSLMIRMMNYLKYEGYKCVVIDLICIGIFNVIVE